MFMSSLFYSILFPYPSTPQMYTPSLHVALPISTVPAAGARGRLLQYLPAALPGEPAHAARHCRAVSAVAEGVVRSEEHTSELQSPCNLVWRLLLDKENDGVCYADG